MYKGTVDVHRLFVGEMDDETADQHYRDRHEPGHDPSGTAGDVARRPGRVRPVLEESLDEVHIDDTVRAYLYPIAAGRVGEVELPGGHPARLEEFTLLITTGFLPQRFRDEMRLSWDPDRQRRFDRLMARLRTVNNLLPRFIRQFPFNVLLKDLD